MNFIQNVSWLDVKTGNHMDAGPRGILIQIGDPCTEFPVPKAFFSEIYKFEFLDIDDTYTYTAEGKIVSTIVTSEWEFRMTEEYAREIICILSKALENRQNVVVHCHAGICRSGAIAEIGEIGEMMGFTPGDTARIPNVWVKKLLMKELGWAYE